MFNLLMFNVDWPSLKVTVPMERMFEYTEDHIAEQFRDSDGKPLLDRLTSLPCLFCEEGMNDETAYVGQINRARIVKEKVSLEISFDADVPVLQNSMIHKNREEPGLHRSSFSRNHWAIKEVDRA